MRQFVVTTEGENRLGLRELCERYVNDQWFAAHASDELAAEALLDQFKRAVRSELELLEVTCFDVDANKLG
jgi:hypothetical protein